MTDMDLKKLPIFLLFGSLPDKKQLADFTQLLANQRSLPTNFVRDVIMKAPSKDIMNGLSRSVLTFYILMIPILTIHHCRMSSDSV